MRDYYILMSLVFVQLACVNQLLTITRDSCFRHIKSLPQSLGSRFAIKAQVVGISWELCDLPENYLSGSF